MPTEEADFRIFAFLFLEKLEWNERKSASIVCSFKEKVVSLQRKVFNCITKWTLLQEDRRLSD